MNDWSRLAPHIPGAAANDPKNRIVAGLEYLLNRRGRAVGLMRDQEATAVYNDVSDAARTLGIGIDLEEAVFMACCKETGVC